MVNVKIIHPINKFVTKVKVIILKYLLNDYVFAHLADESWYEKQFDYLSDPSLVKRLAEEYISARYIYKIFTSVDATGWKRKSQVRMQVLMYASIYEAVIHHILFTQIKNNTTIDAMVNTTYKKEYSIPGSSMSLLKKYLDHDGKMIIPCFNAPTKKDITKIRFDEKATCANKIGIITDELCKDLIEIYEARNAIHIHAEIRKSQNYEIELSRKSYRRMKIFNEQIRDYCKYNNI